MASLVSWKDFSLMRYDGTAPLARMPHMHLALAPNKLAIFLFNMMYSVFAAV